MNKFECIDANNECIDVNNFECIDENSTTVEASRLTFNLDTWTLWAAWLVVQVVMLFYSH